MQKSHYVVITSFPDEGLATNTKMSPLLDDLLRPSGPYAVQFRQVVAARLRL